MAAIQDHLVSVNMPAYYQRLLLAISRPLKLENATPSIQSLATQPPILTRSPRCQLFPVPVCPERNSTSSIHQLVSSRILKICTVVSRPCDDQSSFQAHNSTELSFKSPLARHNTATATFMNQSRWSCHPR
ncbi:hypothetical protein PGT21_014821 [Puccinia graminis f. sp. tritici]|uniref:Uncharacterized protein n=1 Tax=Puccinia graminis f. sp. tritici TaxID=56615 RepID=A0A5B0N7B0_PUCGR|nr:hypothetical protein PGT21_014821 [Puccinia graminis f. sp. tritici]KAA1093262.1 hypothetical protein PGTUg99_005482 [Puccinia graminis f. sp. tritici]